MPRERPHHIPRGEAPKYRFTLKEDKEAKEIAKSEKKAHPNWSERRALSVGYATINKRKHSNKKRR
jgi:hypothetical protein